MATRAETGVVYGAAVVQGVALVTFPAASTILTDPNGYGLTNSAYGALFLPQAVTAITFSLLGAGLSCRVGTRTLYLAGLAANLLSMGLLLTSTMWIGKPTAHAILLVATACLGVGFGLTVPAINTLTAAFHPSKIDSSVLVLNALLGTGTALAPVLVAVFVGLGFWWGLPLLSGLVFAALLAASSRLPLQAGVPAAGAPKGVATTHIPSRFWIFAGFALLYGVCETMNGNWAKIDVTRDLANSQTVGALALTGFWASVTIGRIGFALIQRWLPITRTYHLLPFALAGAFVAIAALPTQAPTVAVLAFALAGLGCSALLPLTITFGQEELASISASVAGGVIAFYQLGYGIAAFGAGPLQKAGVELSTLFGLTAVLAFVMGLLSFAVTPRHHEPAALHPRPAGTPHAA